MYHIITSEEEDLFPIHCYSFLLEVDFGNHVFFQSEHVFLNVYTIDLYSNVHIHHMPVMC